MPPALPCQGPSFREVRNLEEEEEEDYRQRALDLAEKRKDHEWRPSFHDVDDAEPEDDDDFEDAVDVIASQRMLFGEQSVSTADKGNASMVVAHFKKSIKSGSTPRQALQSASSLQLELQVTPEDLEIAGVAKFDGRGYPIATRKMIQRFSQVQVRAAALLKMGQRLKGNTKSWRQTRTNDRQNRRIALPRGLSIPEMSLLAQKLAALSNGEFSVIIAGGGPNDNFRTLTLRIPPTIPPTSRTKKHGRPESEMLNAIMDPYLQNSGTLRQLVFHLHLSGMMAASRETLQSFWGYTANGARECCIKSVAYGVHEADERYVDNIKHKSLRVPTLADSHYVASGSIVMASYLSQMCVAQHKHAQAKVARGPWARSSVSDVFSLGIEAAGEESSTSLLRLVALASPQHAQRFLNSVRKPVRLGGTRSLAIHTTQALYGSGPLLYEAQQHCDALKTPGHAPQLPPGRRLYDAVTLGSEKRHQAAMQLLPRDCRAALDAERHGERNDLSSMAACFNAPTAEKARQDLNALAANHRIDRSEVCKLSLARYLSPASPLAARQALLVS